MKRLIIFFFTAMMLYTIACTSDDNKTDKATASDDKSNIHLAGLEQVNRGEYLVSIMGCGDCHSPKKMTPQGPVPDETRILSGFNSNEPVSNFDAKVMKRDRVMIFNSQLTAFAGPWGTSFAANLTPDDTGIGSWTIDNFKKAIKEGKYKGVDNSRQLLPPMPWQNFKTLQDEDLEAIFAYLKTLKPVNNKVPNAVPPSMATAKM